MHPEAELSSCLWLSHLRAATTRGYEAPVIVYLVEESDEAGDISFGQVAGFSVSRKVKSFASCGIRCPRGRGEASRHRALSARPAPGKPTIEARQSREEIRELRERSTNQNAEP